MWSLNKCSSGETREERGKTEDMRGIVEKAWKEGEGEQDVKLSRDMCGKGKTMRGQENWKDMDAKWEGERMWDSEWERGQGLL